MDELNDTKTADQSASESDKEILRVAGERFTAAQNAERTVRELALEDLEFRQGEQWDSTVKAARDLERRPCLTINRLPQFVRQITNDARQNRPAIRVTPVDGNADVDTAAVLQGLIRHIENDSNAAYAYDTAFVSAVNHGFGYWRVLTEFANEATFDQDIKIRRVRNPFTVYFDPSVQEPDYSDARWAFIVEDVSKETFRATWPKAKLSSMSDWASVGDTLPDWVTTDGARVAEYFYKETTRESIVLLNNGGIVKKSDLTPEAIQSYLEQGLSVVSERIASIDTVKWCKLCGVEVLEKTEWLGKWIPIIPVLGDELDVDGERVLEGIIRHAKDPMRMYNYWATAETEMIALAPKAPYIGAEGQFEGYETQWQQANTKSFAFLQYKPKTVNGDLVPPPQRNSYEPAVQAITNARAQSSDDLKATTGIYDAALGARSNERSGKAILARNTQTQTSNFHFIDNLGRALKHTGRILVDLIPKIYNTQRIIRIIGEDGEVRQQQIGSGIEGAVDLNAGRYDVVMETGPGYASQRQQAVESMLELVQAYPEIAKIAGDLLVKNMDWPGAREIAKRLRKALPPGLAEPEPGESQKELPPEVMQRMQEMGQMIEQLTTALNQAQETIKTKKMELDSKEKIEFARMRVDLITKMAAVHSDETKVGFQAELEVLKTQLDKAADIEAAGQNDAESAAVFQQQLDQMLDKLSSLEQRANQPLNITMPQAKPRVKTARAVPQPDGSFLMEAVERDVDGE